MHILLLEVDSDVISGAFDDEVGVEDRIKLGSSRLSRYWDIRLAHFVLTTN